LGIDHGHPTEAQRKVPLPSDISRVGLNQAFGDVEVGLVGL
jgi:hypothetical protein